MDLAVGSLIDNRYKILSHLGTGGMGAVYKAEDTSMGRQVAIKVMTANSDLSEKDLKRFQHEAVMLSKVSHPNVVSIQRFAVDNGKLFMVLDLVQGESFADLLARENKIDPARVVQIMTQVCDGLICIHELGIIHRDLKPGNLLITKDENGLEIAKIVDFGIARPEKREQRFTESGSIMGSPQYMSPEQWKSNPVDQRSDIYALGCIIFAALSGHPPLQDQALLEVMVVAKESKEIMPYAVLKKSVPPAFARIVRKALQIDPEKRYKTVRDLAKDLKAITDPSWSAKLKENEGAQKKILVAAVLLAIILAAGLGSTNTAALAFARTRVYLNEKYFSPDLEARIKDHSLLVSLYARDASFDLAEKEAKNVLDMVYSHYGEKSVELALTYLTLAEALSEFKEERIPAREYREKALSLFCTSLISNPEPFRSAQICDKVFKLTDYLHKAESFESKEIRRQIGGALYRIGAPKKDRELLARARTLLQENCNPAAQHNRITDSALLNYMTMLASIASIEGDSQASRKNFDAAVRLYPSVKDHVMTTVVLDPLIGCTEDMKASKNPAAAAKMLDSLSNAVEQVYGKGSIELTTVRLSLAQLYLGMAMEANEAERSALIAKAFPIYEEALPLLEGRYQQLAPAALGLAHCNTWSGKNAQSLKYYLICVQACAAAGDQLNAMQLMAMTDYADNLGWLNRHADEEKYCQKIMAFVSEKYGDDSHQMLRAGQLLATALLKQGKRDEAISTMEKIVDIAEHSKRTLSPEHKQEILQTRKGLEDMEAAHPKKI